MDYLDKLLNSATDAASEYIDGLGDGPPAAPAPSPQIIYVEPPKAAGGKFTGLILAAAGLAVVVGAFFMFKKKGK